MNRKRTVTAASGISAVLVAGSSAFAVANGVFVDRPAAHVGDFRTTQVRLVPKPMPRVARGVLRIAAAPSLAPATLPARTYATAVLPEPTSPPVVTRAHAATIARSGPSAVVAQHEERAREDRGEDHGDD